MIRLINDCTYENGIRYACTCDNCKNELEDHYYGTYSEMLCKRCFYSENSEFIRDRHTVAKGEEVCCKECYNDIEEDDVIYKTAGKWLCRDCIEDMYKQNTDDAIDWIKHLEHRYDDDVNE